MKRMIPAFTFLLLCACAPTQPAAPSGDANEHASVAPPQTIEWQSVQTGTGADGVPTMQLTLAVSGSTHIIAQTSCTGIASPVQVEGAVAVRCWWAGGGEDVAAFDKGDGAMRISRRTVDEESGFGEWEDVK